jgi:hypothetical protein
LALVEKVLGGLLTGGAYAGDCYDSGFLVLGHVDPSSASAATLPRDPHALQPKIRHLYCAKARWVSARYALCFEAM